MASFNTLILTVLNIINHQNCYSFFIHIVINKTSILLRGSCALIVCFVSNSSKFDLITVFRSAHINVRLIWISHMFLNWFLTVKLMKLPHSKRCFESMRWAKRRRCFVAISFYLECFFSPSGANYLRERILESLSVFRGTIVSNWLEKLDILFTPRNYNWCILLIILHDLQKPFNYKYFDLSAEHIVNKDHPCMLKNFNNHHAYTRKQGNDCCDSTIIIV